MKKLKTLFYSSLLLLSASSAVAQVSTTNLVARYDFSGNANDVSGNSNTGTVNGATLTTDRQGNPNSAYSFNNADIRTTGLLSPCWSSSANFTIAAWVRITGTTRQDIVYLGDATPNRGITLHVEADGRVRCDLTNAVGPTSVTAVNNNTWRFIAATLTNNVMQIYVDGVASGPTQSMSPQLTCDRAVIGRYVSPGGTASFPVLNGSIDEVSIYSRALTAC